LGASGLRTRLRVLVVALALFALVLPAAALAAFPGTDPAESPRANTPNDPDFDRCEGDDPDTPIGDCDTFYDEEYGAFGFSPDSANETPTGGPLLHLATGTRYADCNQLDPQGKAANVAAENPPAGSETLAQCLQIAGVRADSAFKYTTGDPDVAVAILDTGIRWQAPELVNKVRLNTGELPVPQHSLPAPLAGGADCTGYTSAYDADGNGAVNVLDYACDPRVAVTDGDTESDSILDGSDLIARFSDGTDADSNGFDDDIAGWDFFDDDNDPFDASSCCSANGHGSGRATEAVGETNNANAGIGMCPDCQLLPIRVWDTFVVPTDNYAQGAIYAADNGASVVEGAVGGLTNTQFARKAFKYVDSKGVALTLVSSDINSANHNYPTNYNEAIYVAGSLPDTAPNNTCSGPGGLPGLGSLPSPPAGFQDGCDQFLGLLDDNLGIAPSTQPPTTSFFRNSNLTQYGGKADIVLMGSTGSENTGQASGAAGLIASFGRETFGDDDPLNGNEIRQLLTMTAEDVLGANTGTTGQPDKANTGWDPHFGYGRVNLAGAMARIANDRGPAPAKGSGQPFAWPCADSDATCVPPEAQINAPDWYSPIDVDRVPASGVPVDGLAAAPHSSSGVGDWELEYACGQDALDADFLPIPGGGISGTGPIDGRLGTLPKSMLSDLAANCNGEVTTDAGRPAGAPADGAWPADPYPNPDPERHAFQIRLTVHEAANPANFGRYRKTLFAYSDDGNLPGWPRPLGTGSDASRYETGSGGEVSPRLYDIDGDNKLDVVQGTSSGELWVLDAQGNPLPSFNGGQPVLTDRYATEQHHPIPAGVPTPHESLRVPAIGDIDGDRQPEIVATAGEHVYSWETDGTRTDGFPVRIDPALSDPCVTGVPKPCFDAADRAITSSNHIKRGIFGSPVLADLDGDSRLDIVTGAMDQHVYAWDGHGDPLPGFPAKLATAGADGAEIVATPAVAQLDGTGPPEIVVATNEVAPGDPQFPDSFFDFFGAALQSTTGSNPVYALHGDGTPVAGWPVDIGVAAGDLLPLVLPSHDAAVLDTNGDGTDEVSVSAGTGVVGAGGAELVDGGGNVISNYTSAASPNVTDTGPILNLADYPSIGDLSGGGNPSVIKGGLTINGVANLLAVNQNLPFNHVEQAWDPVTGTPLPGFPRATDDFQLVSQAAVARVSGSGPGSQALVGTGLYQVHAYGADGSEAAGWPKFTGGWTQATPATGDVNGDGNLDVSAVTREGWSFLWSTDVNACAAGANDQWPGFHHDEFNSANYGTDARPPGTPTGLTATPRADGGEDLSWTAPGDDWLCGTADRYELRVSADPISKPSDGTAIGERSATAAGGDEQTDSLTAAEVGTARYGAVLYRDDAGNWGRIASVDLGRGTGPGPGPGADCSTRIDGTEGTDRLSGGAAGESINGRGGNDRIAAGGGDDCVKAGAGNDRASGGTGDDRVSGQDDNDRLRGGAGDDLVRGGEGNDRLNGGAGNDRMQGKGGRDRINGADGADVLRGGGMPDRVSGGDGDDSIEVVGGGRDRVRCGGGHDVVRAGDSDRVARDCERVKRG
jgi:Ca2+-binding RTX toxin-like protein